MNTEFFIDTVRLVHLVGLALGIGAGSFADWSMLRRLTGRITPADLDMLHGIHKHVWFGLALLWASGLVILHARTGFVVSEFSPKLFAKLAVVTVLTLNALLMGLVAMRILTGNVDQSCLEFSLRHKILLCLLGAISVCSWFCGLILGIFSSLKPAGFDVILPLLMTLYCVAILSAFVIAFGLHALWRYRLYREAVRTIGIKEVLAPVSTTIIGQTKAQIVGVDNAVGVKQRKPA